MPSSKSNSYDLGFTAASLRPDLVRVIAGCYLEVGSWEAAREKVLSANALQSRTKGSAIRLERELRSRLESLTKAQIALLAEATSDDRIAMAWLAACKRIPFVFDFAAGVLRDKLSAHDSVLRLSDYESYLERESAIHPELAALKPGSKLKIRQRLLFMLKEAGLLVKGDGLGTISRPVLAPRIVTAIQTDDPGWLAGFLVPDSEISRL